MFFDLASLTKPLVTAPLVFEHLDLDRDWAQELGFKDWPGAITPRLLLSHAAGMPPWLPYTGEPVAKQLANFQAWGRHPLLKKAAWGESTYSDIGFRLLAEILEIAAGRDWTAMGEELSGLNAAPWAECPISMPPGADMDAWGLATDAPFPPQRPSLPHDANARAGMKGHAGFGATAKLAASWLEKWNKKYPALMAIETNKSNDGQLWGLGLQRLKGGQGSFAELLERSATKGLRVIADEGTEDPLPAPPHVPAAPSEWWFHLGYTGPALFVRPSDSACILLLCNRLNSKSQLLNVEELRARRWQLLERHVETLRR
ncbi:MAG: beta-lactamase family protein [Holophagales bacterium]|jgi:CubicO group peptidase (beta-lactamase class C family)|nr:beta-lactamase family protein [Holophagales bacterium]